MSVTGISNNNMGYCKETAAKAIVKQEAFSLQEPMEHMEESQKMPGAVPEQFTGMSLLDLLNSSEGKKNQIPVVNQIVSSKNPEDGEIYLTFFTDDKITCNHADGRKAWEVAIDSTEQAEKVKGFFEKYTPYKWAKELYSGDDMGMTAVKSFWLELFGIE